MVAAHPTLSKLVLARNAIGDDGVGAVLEALCSRATPSLKVLDVRECEVGGSRLQPHVICIHFHRRVHLHAHFRSLPPFHFHFTPTIAASSGGALHEPARCCVLQLGAGACAALQRWLSAPGNVCTELLLSGNDLGEHAAGLAAGIVACRSLVSVRLQACDVGPEFLAALRRCVSRA